MFRHKHKIILGTLKSVAMEILLPYKVLLVGNKNVGKHSFVQRVKEDAEKSDVFEVVSQLEI